MSRFAAFLALCEKNEKSKNEGDQKPKGFNPMESRKRIQAVFLKNPLDKVENTNKGMKWITEEENNRQTKEVLKEKEKQQENVNTNRNNNVKDEQRGGLNKVEFIKLKPIDKKKVDSMSNINSNNKELQREIQEKLNYDRKRIEEPKKNIEKIEVKKEVCKPITNNIKEEKKEAQKNEPKPKEEAKPNPIIKEAKCIVNKPSEVKKTIPVTNPISMKPITEEKPKVEIPQQPKNEVKFKANSFADRLKMFELNNTKNTHTEPSFNLAPKKVSFNPPKQERINVMIKQQEPIEKPKESSTNNLPAEIHNQIQKKVEEKKPIEIKPPVEYKKPIEHVKPQEVLNHQHPIEINEVKKTIPVTNPISMKPITEEKPKVEIPQQPKNEVKFKANSFADRLKMFELNNTKNTHTEPSFNLAPKKVSFNPPKQERINVMIKQQEPIEKPKESSTNNLPAEIHNQIQKKVEEKKPIEIKPPVEYKKPIEHVKPQEEHKEEVLHHQHPIEIKKPIEIQNHKQDTPKSTEQPKPIVNKKPIETQNEPPKPISSFKDRLNMFASKQSSSTNSKPSVKFTDNNYNKPINKVSIKEPSVIPKQENPIVKDPPMNSFEEKRKMMGMRMMMIPGMGMMARDPIHNRNNESSNETKVNTTEIFQTAVQNIQNKPVRKVRRKTVTVGFKG